MENHMNIKRERYYKLVDDVRNDYLSRPISPNSKGIYLFWPEECLEINMWTYWQGKGCYDAKILLVGQDWGSPVNSASVLQNIRDINNDLRSDYEFDQNSPTDMNLCQLFSVLGYDITEKCEDLFFTNYILGYRSKGLSGNARKSWFTDDAPYFTRLVNILEPGIIICLGKNTFENVLASCTGKKQHVGSYNAFIESIQNPVALSLQSGKTVVVFAVAHCGTIGTMNRNRGGNAKHIKPNHRLDLQIKDWKKIKSYI